MNTHGFICLHKRRLIFDEPLHAYLAMREMGRDKLRLRDELCQRLPEDIGLLRLIMLRQFDRHYLVIAFFKSFNFHNVPFQDM